LPAPVNRLLAGVLLSTLCFVAGARADVTFSGLDAEQEKNVRALTPITSAACDSAPWRVRRLFRDAPPQIRGALEALGYYEVALTKSLSWKQPCWHASFDLTVGEPVRLRKVDIRIEGAAAGDLYFLGLIRAGRPDTGDVLDHGRYERYKNTLVKAAVARGYFDAAFSRNEVVVDRGARQADMTLVFASGPRYHISDIRFSKGIIRDSILNGYSGIERGEPYNENKVNDMLAALRGSGYFDSVFVTTEPLDHERKLVPLTVDLTPGKRRVYTAGVGYASDIGPVVRLGYTDRRLNESGHQFESRLSASKVHSELTAAYRWPRSDPRKEWYSVVAGAQHENTDTSNSDLYKLGVRRTQSRSRQWLETRYVDYALEDFSVAGQTGSSRLLLLGVDWEFVEGRELSRARHGRRFDFDIRGASDAFGSDTSFLQLRTSAKWVHSLGARTRVLSHARAGFTIKQKFQSLPASVRFFAGGDRSVRGYAYNSLGPTDENGKVVGGSRLLEGGLEIERMVSANWGIAAFGDSGSAFSGSKPDFSSGLGLGLRWFSPIGPVRLDFAHPLDGSGSSIRLHIIFGPDL